MSYRIDQALPAPGKTLWGPNETIDLVNLRGLNQEGIEVGQLDANPTTGVQRSPRTVVRRLVRNTSGVALLPKRLVTFQAGFNGTRVDGYANATATGPVAVVDEYLPATGVRNGDLFWAVISGPTLVKTDLAGGANNLVPAGTVLVSLTAATSGATTAGRIAPQDLTGATSLLGNQVQNALGRAISGATTGNTDSDLLINFVHRWV